MSDPNPVAVCDFKPVPLTPEQPRCILPPDHDGQHVCADTRFSSRTPFVSLAGEAVEGRAEFEIAKVAAEVVKRARFYTQSAELNDHPAPDLFKVRRIVRDAVRAEQAASIDAALNDPGYFDEDAERFTPLHRLLVIEAAVNLVDSEPIYRARANDDLSLAADTLAQIHTLLAHR